MIEIREEKQQNTEETLEWAERNGGSQRKRKAPILQPEQLLGAHCLEVMMCLKKGHIHYGTLQQQVQTHVVPWPCSVSTCLCSFKQFSSAQLCSQEEIAHKQTSNSCYTLQTAKTVLHTDKHWRSQEKLNIHLISPKREDTWLFSQNAGGKYSLQPGNQSLSVEPASTHITQNIVFIPDSFP